MWASRLAAVAVTVPFLVAVTEHYEDIEAWWWTAALAALVGAVFIAAQFAAAQVARVPHGSRLTAAFAALSLVLFALGFMSLEHYRLPHAATDFAVLYLVFFCAACAAQLWRPAGRLVLAVLVVVLILTAIVQAVHLHTFGFAIGPDGYRAMLQSEPAEVVEFAGRFLTAGTLGAMAVALAVAFAAAFGALPVRAPGRGVAWAGVHALAAVAILGGNAALVVPRTLGLAETFAYASEIWEFRAVRKARGERTADLMVAQRGALAGQPQVYVFLVGESLTRNHMSLYGYWRDTTPSLANLAPEMAIFRDVVSPHSHTDQSLELVLTLARQGNGLTFTDPKNYSVIELLRAAGFSTWWISNQNSFGPWDNKVSALARSAEHVHYTGARSGRTVLGPYDEALVEPFAAALRDPAPRKVIFLHVLGNHWEYEKRYPPEAAAFRVLPTAAEVGALRGVHTHPELVNAYDNAVRYHDQLVSRFIEMLRAERKPSVFVLFSDHGENVYGQKGHYWRLFTHDHVEVPLLLWFSPQYAELARDVVKRARANSAAPFALEDLPHLVADLTGLASGVFERDRSPLSAEYQPRPRPLFENTLVYEQADEPILNVRRALDRLTQSRPELRRSLWAHRVDTLGKMMESARTFSGVEIDVVYDAESRSLLVNHPPTPPSGLALDTLLAYAHRLNPQLSVWLDLKNFNETNAARVLEALEQLDRAYAIRARTLVETDHTGPAAAALRAAGYRSSYYLPPSLLAQQASPGVAFSCYGASDVQRAVLARRFAAVSYDWRGRGWVERCLGRFLREQRLPTYVWDLELIASERAVAERFDAERARSYGSVAAVLVPFRSLFDDWR
jgi:heptose-I-phosphate ethanolaminephosphotransferase